MDYHKRRPDKQTVRTDRRNTRPGKQTVRPDRRNTHPGKQTVRPERKRSRARVPEAIALAFSMFTVIPMPEIAWERENLRNVLCAFPLTGCVIGLCWFAWGWLCLRAGVSDILRGAGWCLIPVVLTGGIHLDGYADTSDALASHTDPVRRREILKDPHCGAFAVIRLCMYFVGTFALCASLRGNFIVMAWGFVLSRALSGTALTILPLASDGLAHTFVTAAEDKTRIRRVLICETAAVLTVMCVSDPLAGVCMTAAAFVTLMDYARTAERAFGGTSGDLAGWFVQRAEFWMLAVLTASEYIRR